VENKTVEMVVKDLLLADNRKKKYCCCVVPLLWGHLLVRSFDLLDVRSIVRLLFVLLLLCFCCCQIN